MSIIDGGYSTTRPVGRYGNPSPYPGPSIGQPGHHYTSQEVRELFADYSLVSAQQIANAVPGGRPTETAPQRILRILSQLNSGQRTWADVTHSISQLPGAKAPGSGAPGQPGVGPQTGVSGLDRDAFARGKAILDLYGLSDLAPWLEQEITNGTSIEAMQIDLQSQPAFKQRFWVIDKIREQGGRVPTPTDIMNFEDTWTSMAHAAGLTGSLADRSMAQKFMEKHVSPSEAQERIQKAYVEMRNQPAAVKDAFASYFGARGDGALASLMLNPEVALPDLERMVSEAEIGGFGQQQGFGVSQSMAERIARQGIGGAQAQQGFDQLRQQRALFQQTIDEQAPLTAETGMEATFGLSGDAANRVKQVADTRKATFEGRVDAVENQTGITGTGQARSV